MTFGISTRWFCFACLAHEFGCLVLQLDAWTCCTEAAKAANSLRLIASAMSRISWQEPGQPNVSRLIGGWRQRRAAVAESEVSSGECSWPGPDSITKCIAHLGLPSCICHQAALSRGAAAGDVAVPPVLNEAQQFAQFNGSPFCGVRVCVPSLGSCFF